MSDRRWLPPIRATRTRRQIVIETASCKFRCLLVDARVRALAYVSASTLCRNRTRDRDRTRRYLGNSWRSACSMPLHSDPSLSHRSHDRDHVWRHRSRRSQKGSTRLRRPREPRHATAVVGAVDPARRAVSGVRRSTSTCCGARSARSSRARSAITGPNGRARSSRSAPDDNNVIYPTALFDFGLLPSVGVYYAGSDLFAKDNTLRIHVATWGPQWLAATAADRYNIDTDDTVQAPARLQPLGGQPVLRHRLRVTAMAHSPATASSASSRARATATRLAKRIVHPRVRQASTGSSFNDGTCCSNPSVDQQVAAGVYALPPGFGETYATAYGGVDSSSIARAPGRRRASGAYLHAYWQPNFDLHEDRSWHQYGGEIGEAVDLHGHQRVLKIQLALGFVDQLAGWRRSRSPSITSLGGELDAGLHRRLDDGPQHRGRAARLYAGRSGSGSTRGPASRSVTRSASTSRGLRPGELRMSYDIGLTTASDARPGLRDPVRRRHRDARQGAGITSLRFALRLAARILG